LNLKEREGGHKTIDRKRLENVSIRTHGKENKDKRRTSQSDWRGGRVDYCLV